MLPAARRGFALALVIVLLVPGAAAQVPARPPPPERPDPTPPTPPNATPYDPDLYPTSLSVTARDTRTNATLCANVQDLAQAPSAIQTENPIGPFWVKFDVYLARQDDSDTLWSDGQKQHTSAMAPQSTASVCMDFALPAGKYGVNVLVDSEHDVPEADELNNARPRNVNFTVSPSPLADLQVSKLTVSPSPAGDGKQVGVRATVTNAGDAPSAATNVTLRDGAGYDRSFAVRALGAKQSVDVLAAFLANDHVAGRFDMVATVDPLDLVKEYAIDNNDATASFLILPHPAPDLVVGEAHVNGSLLARHGLRVDARVDNVGNRTSNATSVRLLVDGVVNSNASLPSVKNAASASVEFFLLLGAGNHSLRLVVDPDLRVSELDETNNAREMDVEIREPAADESLPNLAVRRLSAAPDDPLPNETVTVTAIVGNLGQAAANATTIQFEVGGVVLGRSKVAAIAPERSLSVTFAWPVHQTGPYALRARVDPDENVTELDDDDNALTLFLTISPPPEPEAAPVDEPTAPTPVTPTPGGGGAPAEPTLPPPTSASPTGIDITKVVVSTRAVPGGVKGIATAALRNPAFEPLARVIVTFRVDGATVKEQLLQNVAAAGVSSATTGDVDLPAGNHTVTVEARVVGTDLPPASVTQTYDTAPGPRGVPGPAVAWALVAAVVAGALVHRKRR